MAIAYGPLNQEMSLHAALSTCEVLECLWVQFLAALGSR